jgi:LAS superfamily LD-carboxypeptidase LdcB
MARELTAEQLTGLDESHLVELPCGHHLQEEAARAFTTLQADAHEAGFDLAIASSFRSFARQLAIWNGKASGQRPVYDDRGCQVMMAALEPEQQLHAILRFSAIPGTSRHHWGTDLDIYDAAALPADYVLQLSPAEVAPGGLFDPLHNWLDGRIAAGQSHGFFRPYGEDRGGVAPERWHLSYAPLALGCAAQVGSALLHACWDCEDASGPMLLRPEIESSLSQLMMRYVTVAGGWCEESSGAS